MRSRMSSTAKYTPEGSIVRLGFSHNLRSRRVAGNGDRLLFDAVAPQPYAALRDGLYGRVAGKAVAARTVSVLRPEGASAVVTTTSNA